MAPPGTSWLCLPRLVLCWLQQFLAAVARLPVPAQSSRLPVPELAAATLRRPAGPGARLESRSPKETPRPASIAWAKPSLLLRCQCCG